MVGQTTWRHRHVVPSSRARQSLRAVAVASLYGRALALPPPALTAHARGAEDAALAAGLRPFQRRLHRQRATVTLARFVAAALGSAFVVMIVRIGGASVPLPVAPLAAAAAVLVLGLSTFPWLGPSAPQIAHALDRRLDVHEQFGSALDAGAAEGELMGLLRERARLTLQQTTPLHVLPWPSMGVERATIAVAIALVATSAIIAAHMPAPALHVATRATIGSGRHPAVRHATVGRPSRTRLAILSNLLVTGKVHALAPTRVTPLSRPGIRRVAGPGSTGRPAGRAGNTPGSATGTGRSANGVTLHLTSNRNSSTGAGQSLQQQQLQQLQNSVSSATRQSQTQGGSNGARSGTYAAENGRGGNQGPSTTAQSSTRRGSRQTNGGTGTAGTRSHKGTGVGSARGRQGQKASGSHAAGSTPGQGNGRARGYGGYAGDGLEQRRQGNRGAGPGTGSGGGPASTQSATDSQARLSSGSLALTGPGEPNGQRLIVGVGAPTRGGGVSGMTTGGSGSYAGPNTPGYVAPDSNAVATDDRSVVRAYFTPPS